MSKRQKAREVRRDAFYGAKYAAAKTSAARAAVRWDALRSTIADMPADQAAKAWRQVEESLEGLARRVAQSHVRM